MFSRQRNHHESTLVIISNGKAITLVDLASSICYWREKLGENSETHFGQNRAENNLDLLLLVHVQLINCIKS